MSETFTLTAGQVFTGGTTLGGGDTGEIALGQTASVGFDTTSTPETISDIDMLKDTPGGDGFVFNVPFLGPETVQIDSASIGTVTQGAVITLTTSDLTGSTTVPPGFTLPQNVTGETFAVTVASNHGTFSGTAALLGVDGSLGLVALETLDVDGIDVNAGAAILSDGQQFTGSGLDEDFTPAFLPIETPCYLAGTGIATPAGERAVETLAQGDLVLAASGEARPVAWIGFRHVDCRRHPRPETVLPVRVRAGAFGDGLPHRDLFLSPDHAVFFDDVLIPIRCLVNGTTIARQAAERVNYWHVELDRHDVILAHGLPCESFLDTGNRGAFANGGAPVQMHADFSQRLWDADACAPLVLDGPHLLQARRRLLACAIALGHATAVAA